MASKTNKKSESPVKSRTLLCMGSEGEFKITIPEGARVTFGPNVPFTPRANAYASPDRGYSLRVYEGKGNDTLIAVFSNVASFRDITLPHAKLVVREAGKSMWKSDENGYEVSESVSRESAFIDSARQLASAPSTV